MVLLITIRKKKHIKKTARHSSEDIRMNWLYIDMKKAQRNRATDDFVPGVVHYAHIRVIECHWTNKNHVYRRRKSTMSGATTTNESKRTKTREVAEKKAARS